MSTDDAALEASALDGANIAAARRNMERVTEGRESADIARDCERADEIAADDYVPRSFLDYDEEAAIKRARALFGTDGEGRFNVHVLTYEDVRVDRAIIQCWPDDTWGALRARVEGVFPVAATAIWRSEAALRGALDDAPLSNYFPEPRQGITICLVRGPVERAPAPALPDPDPRPGRKITLCAAE